MWRDPQPTWTSPAGHLVQVGDAAHTFLPSSGNGGNQAIEDAVSLAACLDIAGKDGIPLATRTHNLLRFERVSCLQALGVVNQQMIQSGDGDGKKKVRHHMGKWIFAHDPEAYAYDNFEMAAKHVTEGTVFQNTNIPPGMVYKPWTIDGLLDAKEKGEQTVLDGDWD